nr:50S ribosomal protein L15P, large subunit ribosomal protein L15 [uncultured archaeon]
MRFRKKKATKQRASTYHGWGRGQAHHKGAGNRGGRGRAGTGKRADTKKPSFWKEPTGKKGFTSKSRKIKNAINLEKVYINLNEWINKGFASKNNAGYQVDIKKAGYDKLLAGGETKEKLFITVDFASKNAIEKVKAAGGEVKVLKTIIKKQKKKTEKPKKAEAKQAEEKAEESNEIE